MRPTSCGPADPRGHCRAYATTAFAAEAPAKAVAFALPTRSGSRLT
ncbi:hypothetical protein ACFQVD_14250 [Streptosporangium amethystogenes subsp. fukuiense]|uniref:Uncharacterized protein n=1 Tax=Streptosporangium amethystogenes subsp. fukuiense TaxID=698418 RepID=A0ABW2SY46_9ACTN